MMDMSLDDYIGRPHDGDRSSVKNRLGQKPTSGRTNFKVAISGPSSAPRQTQRQQRPPPDGSHNINFNVTGLNKVTFDARQKINPKRPQPVMDARQHLANKHKYGQDARVRIQNRTAQKSAGPKLPGPIPRVVPPGSNPNDMRIKIQSKTDARQMIQRRQEKGLGKKFVGHTKVTIAGVSDSGSAESLDLVDYQVSEYQGSLMKTVKVEADMTQENKPLMKTIRNSTALGTNRIGNNIVLTQSNSYPSQQLEVHMEPPQPHYTHPPPQLHPQPQTLAPHQFAPAYTQQYVHDPYPPQPQYAPLSQHSVVQDPHYTTLSQPTLPQEPQYAPTPPQYTYQQKPMPVVASTSQRRQFAEPPQSSIEGRLGAEIRPQEEGVTDFSPLQGYRLAISNLHPIVTQEDIMELFGAVGALKRARLIKPGTAEVVFVKRDEAMAALKKYHKRELDGQPMLVVLVSGEGPRPSSQETSAPLRLPASRTSSAVGDVSADVDVSLLHKALFKTTTKEDTPQRPVTFTVKI